MSFSAPTMSSGARSVVLEMELRRRMQVEVRETRLVEDLAGLGDGVALVRGGSFLGRERVDEPVRELLGRQRHDPVPLRRMRECRRGSLERGERQQQDALRRRRAQRDARAPEPAVEQQLDDQAAERMADQHGRLVERADQPLVVVDDLGEAETRKRRRRPRAAPRRRPACAATPEQRRRNRACRSSRRSSPSCATRARRRESASKGSDRYRWGWSPPRFLLFVDDPRRYAARDTGESPIGAATQTGCDSIAR